MSLFRLAIIHLRESLKSKTTHMKHNCMSLCNFVKEHLKRLDLSMRHRDKHKIVFLCSLRLEKRRTNRTYVHRSRYAKHGLGYCDFVITIRHCLKSHNKHVAYYPVGKGLFNVSKITKEHSPFCLCSNIIFLTLKKF